MPVLELSSNVKPLSGIFAENGRWVSPGVVRYGSVPFPWCEGLLAIIYGAKTKKEFT